MTYDAQFVRRALEARARRARNRGEALRPRQGTVDLDEYYPGVGPTRIYDISAQPQLEDARLIIFSLGPGWEG